MVCDVDNCARLLAGSGGQFKPALTAVLDKQKNISLSARVALAVVGLSSLGAILVHENGDYLGAGDHYVPDSGTLFH